MRKWVVRVIVIALIIGGAYAVQVKFLAPTPVVVGVIHPQRGRVESTVTNSKAGTVKARRKADLSPEIGGRVVGLPVAKGSLVKRGDLLLRLDDSSQRARLQKARLDVATSEARTREACLGAEYAEREHVRYRSLADRQIVSSNLLDQLASRAETAAAACEAAGAAIQSAEATIAVLESELQKTVIRAPFDGIVAELSIELGEFTTPSPPGLPIPPVLQMFDTSSIYISAPMDEVDSARIKSGQSVRVTIDSYPERSFSATVARVAPYVLDIETQNRTVEIEVQLQDSEFATHLLPGTSADVEVILEVRDDVLRLPTSALLQGAAVLVVEGDILVRRQIDAGLRNWNFTEIRSGLGTSDRVVTTLDRVDVQPGAQVLVAGEPAPG